MYNKLTIALAMASAVSAAPALAPRQDPCQDAYKACIAAGTPEVACSCTLTACVGEDNARNREYCATATADLPKPTSTGIPGGCNPAHPGSCPSSYFTYPTASASAAPSFTSIPGIPGGCNPAHPGSCPSSYFTYPTASASAAPTFTPIPGIPGGCNPAHPGSCPSSYFTYPTVSATAAPAPTGGSSSGYTDPKPVEGRTWTIKDLTRYCGEDNSGCDYNFKIEADGVTEACTVIRMPGLNAATESWSNQPCTSGSKYQISWGYVAEPAPAFAVLSVVDGKEIAWFGVSNVNGQPVTTAPSNPFGSGQFGNLGPEQVYTY
ncbi:surface protein SP1 [Colletotrichum asianum]